MMNGLILAVALCAQPAPVSHYKLLINEDIVTKIYIQADMPDGKRIEVPIINNWVPDIWEETENGVFKRVFDYNSHRPFTGKVNYTWKNKPQPAAPLTPVPPLQNLAPTPAPLNSVPRPQLQLPPPASSDYPVIDPVDRDPPRSRSMLLPKLTRPSEIN